MPDNKSFSSKGFSRKPLDEDEVAQIRALVHEVSEEWPTLKAAARLAAAAGTLAKVLAASAALGAFLTWLVGSGFFG